MTEPTQPNPAVFKIRRQTALERFDASERGRRLRWLEAKRQAGGKLSSFQRGSYRSLIAARRVIAGTDTGQALSPQQGTGRTADRVRWPEKDRAGA